MKTSQLEVEPRPTRISAGQVMTRTHQQSIDVAIDSMQEDDYSGLPDLETMMNKEAKMSYHDLRYKMIA